MELRLANKHGSGCEKIDTKAILAAKPTHLAEDITYLAFRFYGKAPMVGYRDGRTFHILWLDREFKVYKH